MAIQELSPLPPVTGYSQLGQVISGAGDRYSQQRRQDELMALARQQQLADVASARAEWDRTHGITRGEQLDDVNSARNEAYRLRDLTRGDQLTDLQVAREREDAVAARKRGEHLEDYGVSFAYQQAAQIAEETRKLAAIAPDKANAKNLATSYGQQLLAARKSMSDATRILTSEPPQYGPTSPDVQNLAQIMSGGSKDKKQIEPYIVPAMEKLNNEALFKHSQAVKGAQITLQMLANTERQLTDMIQTVAQTFKVVPDTPAPPVGGAVGGDLGSPTSTGAQSMAPATPAGLNGAINRVLGVPQPTPSGTQRLPVTGTAGTNLPPPTTSVRANQPSPYNFPALSAAGLLERYPMASVDAVTGAADRLSETPGRFDRALGGIGAGLLTGDYSLPERGGLQQIGEATIPAFARFLRPIEAIGEYVGGALAGNPFAPGPTPEEDAAMLQSLRKKKSGRPITSAPMLFPEPVR